jgi:hypothetical protein
MLKEPATEMRTGWQQHYVSFTEQATAPVSEHVWQRTNNEATIS